MSRFVKKTDRMDVFIEESSKQVLVQQKWRYNWLNSIGTSRWTLPQKTNFHDRVDKLIWSKWGEKISIKVRGTSVFAIANRNSIFKLFFDVKWVIAGEHWNVNVTKIPKGKNVVSNTVWNTRVINLDTQDTVLTYKNTKNNVNHYQFPVVHEFGHAVGNSIFAASGMHGDEYNIANNIDYFSVMNIGNELRKKHADYIISQLNTMIPNTTFYV